MASHFHSLTVSDVRQETPDCISIAFSIPETLRETFAYTQGQHLTVRAKIRGVEVRRNYSLCSSPLDGEWRIAVKRVPGGQFSQWAHTHVQPGDTLEVLPPAGRFYTPLQPGQRKNYVAFASGSGITPVMSIIKTTLLTEPESFFTLVYGNRSKNSIIFHDALEALKDKYIHRFRIIYVLSREHTDADINHGRIDATKIMQLCQKLISLPAMDECFICGPQEMIFAVRDFLIAAGVPTTKIHFELFASGRTLAVQTAAFDDGDIVGGPASQVTIRIDGSERNFRLPYHGHTILDAALQQGADLPYACKGGVCCTCKAKLLEGQVHMAVVYGLEPDEIAAGYILTCQSHPLTPVVKVDYDG
jgi:ring-1,2-phenylacetyl-CoA epoxidase subunit PaaE